MKQNKLLAGILASAVALTSGIIPNAAFYASGATYRDEDGAFVIGYNRLDLDKDGEYDGVEITSCGITDADAFYLPDEIDDLPVVKIAASAFKGNSKLTSIELPSGVISIGSNAFESCSSLESASIPDGVEKLGDSLFKGCKALTSVSIGDGPAAISNSMFYNCPELSDVTIPSSVLSIGSSAFYKCSALGDIPLENGIMSIGSSAFAYCTEISEITLPETLTTIGESAFENCSALTSVDIQGPVEKIPNKAFYKCVSLDTITLGSNIANIGDNAFYSCTALSNITIPSSVQKIGDSAFKGCSGLSDLVFADGVTALGSSAFYGCDELSSVTIPSTVKEIGNKAVGYSSSGRVAENFKILGVPGSAAEVYANTNKIPFEEVKFDPALSESSLNLVVGETAKLILWNYAGNAEWESSDEDVASVDSGVVTALSEGTATIYAYLDDEDETVLECEVEVSEEDLMPRLSRTNVVFVMGSGDTTQLEVLNYDGEIEWKSADESIVTIDQGGNIAPAGAGETVVYAVLTDEGITLTCSVAVTGNDPADTTTSADDPGPSTTTETTVSTPEPIAPGGISLSDTQITLSINGNMGETEHQLTVLNYDGEVTWSSSDERFVTVDSNGLVRPAGWGSATVYAKAGDVTLECLAYVYWGGAPNLSDEEITIKVGETKTLTATYSMYHNSYKWNSSDSSIALVEPLPDDDNGTKDQTAIIMGLKEGTATVYVDIYGIASQCVVNVVSEGSPSVSTTTDVNPDPTTSTTVSTAVSGDQYDIVIGVGDSVMLEVSGVEDKISWTSGNKDIAEITGDIMTGISEGFCKIFALIGDSVSTFDVLVTGTNGSEDPAVTTTTVPTGVPGDVTSSTSETTIAFAAGNGSVDLSDNLEKYFTVLAAGDKFSGNGRMVFLAFLNDDGSMIIQMGDYSAVLGEDKLKAPGIFTLKKYGYDDHDAVMMVHPDIDTLTADGVISLTGEAEAVPSTVTVVVTTTTTTAAVPETTTTTSTFVIVTEPTNTTTKWSGISIVITLVPTPAATAQVSKGTTTWMTGTTVTRATLATTTTRATTAVTTTTHIRGDANGDKQLNVRDAAFIASMLSQKKAAKLPDYSDFNGDGTVNVRDAAAIAKYLAKRKLT